MDLRVLFGALPEEGGLNAPPDTLQMNLFLCWVGEFLIKNRG